MPRVPRAAWALSLAATAVLGLGATGCKSKAEEPAAQERLPEQRVAEEWLPEPEPLLETGVLERDWDVYAGEMDDRNRYGATVMTSVNTLKSNILFSKSAPSTRGVLLATASHSRSRLLRLGEQKWPQFGPWSEDAVEPREVCLSLPQFSGQWDYAANSLGRTARSYSTGLK